MLLLALLKYYFPSAANVTRGKMKTPACLSPRLKHGSLVLLKPRSLSLLKVLSVGVELRSQALQTHEGAVG